MECTDASTCHPLSEYIGSDSFQPSLVICSCELPRGFVLLALDRCVLCHATPWYTADADFFENKLGISTREMQTMS